MDIKTIKAALRSLHENIPGVGSVPVARRKIETAMLPCVFVRTSAGAWTPEDSGHMVDRRTFVVECLVAPLPQNVLEANEDLVDEMIEAFVASYCENYHLYQSSWIDMTTITDGGIQIIDYGTLYYGFVFEFDVMIREI